MRAFYSLMFVTMGSLVLHTATAWAQPADSRGQPSGEPSSDEASPPSLPSSSIPAVEAAPVEAASTTVTEIPQVPPCGAGAIKGVDPIDAETAVWLVCQEIHKYSSRPASLSPADPPAVYRVGLMKLGEKVFLTVHVEAPVGSVRDSRQISLASIEELPIATPRIVKALFAATTISDTQTISTLVGEENREYKKRHGEYLFGGGLVGSMFLGMGARIVPALDLRVGYETEQLGIGLGTRISLDNSRYDEDSTELFTFQVGARYFLSNENTSLFFGGGLAYASMEARKDGEYYEGGGLGAYGEVGVELLRLYSSRLTFDLQVFAPTFPLKTGEYFSGWDPETGVYTPQPEKSMYAVPVLVGVSYSF